MSSGRMTLVRMDAPFSTGAFRAGRDHRDRREEALRMRYVLGIHLGATRVTAAVCRHRRGRWEQAEVVPLGPTTPWTDSEIGRASCRARVQSAGRDVGWEETS